MIAAVNAIGNHVPPMLIFPRVNFKDHMINGAPAGTIGGANPSGWSTEQLFLKYLKHFISFVKPTEGKKVLLIMDNHDTHIAISVIDEAKKKMLFCSHFRFTPPTNCSHWIEQCSELIKRSIIKPQAIGCCLILESQ